jgi:hypothetical protein
MHPARPLLMTRYSVRPLAPTGHNAQQGTRWLVSDPPINLVPGSDQQASWSFRRRSLPKVDRCHRAHARSCARFTSDNPLSRKQSRRFALDQIASLGRRSEAPLLCGVGGSSLDGTADSAAGTTATAAKRTLPLRRRGAQRRTSGKTEGGTGTRAFRRTSPRAAPVSRGWQFVP